MDRRAFIGSLFGTGVLGAFLQIAGANWDVSSHILGIVDTFFTTPHLVLYLGILLSLVAGLSGVWLSRRTGYDRFRPALFGLRITLAGSAIQLVAGPLDFWWHSTYGFDPYLFTPTHSMLIVGIALIGVGMVVGSSRLMQVEGGRLVKAILIVALSSLWLDVNFVVLWLINSQGIAYTFQICSPGAISARACSFVNSYETVAYLPALFLDALGGATVILLAKALLGRRGLLTMVAAVVLSVYAIPDLGYTAYMLLYVGAPGSFYFVNPTTADGAQIAAVIPLYLTVLGAVALLDATMGQNKRARTIGALVAGPISVFSDGRFAIFSGLWSPHPALVIYLVPMALGGLAAVRLEGRAMTSLIPTWSLTSLGARSPRVR